MCFWQTLCFVLWAEDRCWEVRPGCFLFPENVCVCHNDVPNTWGLKQKRTLSFRFLCASEPAYDHSQEVTTLRASAACWCCSELYVWSIHRAVHLLCQDKLQFSTVVRIRRATIPFWHTPTNHEEGVEKMFLLWEVFVVHAFRYGLKNPPVW